jgi:hypothetical protein
VFLSIQFMASFDSFYSKWPRALAGLLGFLSFTVGYFIRASAFPLLLIHV